MKAYRLGLAIRQLKRAQEALEAVEDIKLQQKIIALKVRFSLAKLKQGTVQ